MFVLAKTMLCFGKTKEKKKQQLKDMKCNTTKINTGTAFPKWRVFIKDMELAVFVLERSVDETYIKLFDCFAGHLYIINPLDFISYAAMLTILIVLADYQENLL